uniref:Putative zinc finger, SWIM-type n=1 Tax=Helianthus annuus TaxID=4232 RepID=A0A251S9V4_HELAN
MSVLTNLLSMLCCYGFLLDNLFRSVPCPNVSVIDWGVTRWEVVLDERTCTCRVWQVKGIPCLHAAAFIAFTRDINWEKFVDSYFTIEKFECALKVAHMPTKDQWVHIDAEEKIYPPTIKRLPRRPRKNRIRANDEQRKKYKCRRCGGYGHQQK